MGKQNRSRNKGKYKTVSIPNESSGLLAPVAAPSVAPSTPARPRPASAVAPDAPNSSNAPNSSKTPVVSLSRSTPRSSSVSRTVPSPVVPRSVPLSGHTWKASDESGKARKSSLSKSPHIGIKSPSVGARMRQRQNREIIKQKAAALEEASRADRAADRQRQEQKAKQKAENEKKSQVVQVISDTSKIKKMTPKQKRLLQKM